MNLVKNLLFVLVSLVRQDILFIINYLVPVGRFKKFFLHDIYLQKQFMSVYINLRKLLEMLLNTLDKYF